MFLSTTKSCKNPMSSSSNGVAISKNHKFLLPFCLLASLLVTCAATSHSIAQTIIQSSCSSTLYPDLCVSAISGAPDAASKVKNPKDVIELSVNLTITAAQANYNKIKNFRAEIKNLTRREQTAFDDCLEMVDETMDELYKVVQDLEEYPSFKKSISSHADDLKTLVSAAMTNQDSCLYGFSEEVDEKVGKLIKDDETHVYNMCSNALAMITNLTDTDMAKEGQKHPNSQGRNPEAERINNHDGTEWPGWLSGGDRKLLQAGTATPDVVVAADGSGNFKTVAEAVAASPEKSSKRYIIRIKAGVYRENVDVPKKKTNIMFLGDGKATTIITGNRNVVDGSTTFNSATVAAVGDGFLARDITFQNTAGPSKHQAVALRVGSDLSAFYQCDMIAYQDTLYVHSLRQFYVNCFITGTVDFIFGNAAVVLQNCDIRARRPNPGQRNLVTAQGRNDPNQNTGIVIQKSKIGATQDLAAAAGSFRSFLGRPWRLYSRTVVMQSDISGIIDPAGWHEWDGNFALDTLFYAEFGNTGAGAGTSGRVQWKGFKVISDVAEAQGFSAGNFIQGGSWLSSTGFPFTLGL